jgi:hypothetical protein
MLLYAVDQIVASFFEAKDKGRCGHRPEAEMALPPLNPVPL